MGLFGFIGNVVGGSVKIAATPIAVLDDVYNVLSGNEVNSTEMLIKSAGKSFEDGIDEIMP